MCPGDDGERKAKRALHVAPQRESLIYATAILDPAFPMPGSTRNQRRKLKQSHNHHK